MLVAIKQLLDPTNAEAREGLIREFELLEQVMHRSICKVYEFLEEEDAVVMEYVEGLTLREVFEAVAEGGAQIPVEAALEMGIELADCLYQSYASPSKSGGSLNLVHRDIKPENVMLTLRGEVKVLDFGLAKVTKGGRRRDGQQVGTPLYMAPEQAMGRPIDHRTDLFAVGLVLFEMLMGRPAYDVPDDATTSEVKDTMLRIEKGDLRHEIRDLEKRLPGPGPVVSRLLKANPRGRYPNGHELLVDLRRHTTRDRGAHLTEFSDYFFNNVRPLESASRKGDAGGTGATKPGTHSRPKGDSMSNSKPPRPGGGPPRPGGAGGGPGPRSPASARPAPSPRSGQGGKGSWRPPSVADAADAAVPDVEEVEESVARSPDESGMLQMRSLADADEGDDEPKNKSATAFFAIPKSKSKRRSSVDTSASAPPAAGPPSGGGGASGRALPGMAPPGSPAASGAPPGGFAAAAPGMGMGISGPVAAGPVAQGPVTPFSGAPGPDTTASSTNRSTSFRVYAIVLALMGVAMLAMTVVVVAFAFVYFKMGDGDGDVSGDNGAVVDAEPRPKGKKTKTEDTGGALPEVPKTKPRPKRKPKPKSSGGGSTTAAPMPPPKPKAPVGPAPISVKWSGSEPYTSVQVKCPSGFSGRGSASGGSAVIKDVPNGEDCVMSFLGGAPTKFMGAKAGKSYSCTFGGGRANCK